MTLMTHARSGAGTSDAVHDLQAGSGRGLVSTWAKRRWEPRAAISQPGGWHGCNGERGQGLSA